MVFGGNEGVDRLSDGMGGESAEDGRAVRCALAHSSLVI